MIGRIEIMYDFDYRARNYYNNGLNYHPSLRFRRNEDIYLPLEAIRERDDLDCLYLLGAGMDKICICYSVSKSCFIVEPCPALYFILKMEETFQYFLKEKKKGKIEILNGGIYLMESLFRSGGQRGENEIHLSITFKLINKEWKIGFGRAGSENQLILDLNNFLSAYFEFAERMVEFYNFTLPQYKEFTYHYPLFMKAVNDSDILKEFQVIKQSSFDELTYYDYQR